MIPDEVLRNRIARIIAATRFPFVDQTDWGEGYVTIVNDEEKRRGIEGPEGTFYPSIVVTYANNGIREVGDVEMDDGVSEAHVPKWRLMSEKTGKGRRVKKFFLYVPEGREDEAMRLLEDNGIEYAGLRAWAIRDGNLVVKPIKTPDEPKDHR